MIMFCFVGNYMQVTGISWKENELNMVDTPGHADFGGEVCPFFIKYTQFYANEKCNLSRRNSKYDVDLKI